MAFRVRVQTGVVGPIRTISTHHTAIKSMSDSVS